MKDNFEQAWQKFKDFVSEYMQNLQGQKSQLDKAMESEKIISSLSKEKSLKAVLEARDVLTFLDPSLKLDIEMLAFFEANQAILLPQVTEILEKILSSPIILNYAENTLENQKKLQMIKANISECQKIIGGGAFSFIYLTSLLEFSSLTEEDKIDVLSKVVYESSPKALKKDIKDFSLPSVPESFSVEELLNEYQLLLTKGNFFAQKYYFLLEGKNESQINYMKTVVSCLKEEKDLKNSFQYKDENMAVLLLEFFDIKELLSDFVSKIEDPKNVSEETRDMVILYIDSLKECIQNILQLEPAFEKSQKSSQPVDTLLFLLDENNQPLFQLNKFSLEERNRIANLIRGLLSGKKDFERGIKHSKLLTRQDLDIDVFLNKNGDMVVSYILLSDNSFLLLTFDRKKNIYDVSESIVRKYKSKILSLDSSNLGMFLDSQKEFKENLYKDLGIERELKL